MTVANTIIKYTAAATATPLLQKRDSIEDVESVMNSVLMKRYQRQKRMYNKLNRRQETATASAASTTATASGNDIYELFGGFFAIGKQVSLSASATATATATASASNLRKRRYMPLAY